MISCSPMMVLRNAASATVNTESVREDTPDHTQAKGTKHDCDRHRLQSCGHTLHRLVSSSLPTRAPAYRWVYGGHLGLTHHKLGEFEDTGRVLKQAIALAPNSPLAVQAQTILDELR